MTEDPAHQLAGLREAWTELERIRALPDFPIKAGLGNAYARVAAILMLHVPEILDALETSTEAARIEGAKVMRERCAKVAELRMDVFGGEPTTMNERLIVRTLANAIKALDPRNIDQAAG